jgi:hypothetical protein
VVAGFPQLRRWYDRRGIAMALKKWTIRLDEDFLRRIEDLAEQQGTTAENLVIEFLHRWLKQEKLRRLRKESLRANEERPTASLKGPLSASGDSAKEVDKNR